MLLVVPARESSLCGLGRASGIFLEEEGVGCGEGISMSEQAHDTILATLNFSQSEEKSEKVA